MDYLLCSIPHNGSRVCRPVHSSMPYFSIQINRICPLQSILVYPLVPNTYTELLSLNGCSTRNWISKFSNLLLFFSWLPDHPSEFIIPWRKKVSCKWLHLLPLPPSTEQWTVSLQDTHLGMAINRWWAFSDKFNWGRKEPPRIECRHHRPES